MFKNQHRTACRAALILLFSGMAMLPALAATADTGTFTVDTGKPTLTLDADGVTPTTKVKITNLTNATITVDITSAANSKCTPAPAGAVVQPAVPQSVTVTFPGCDKLSTAVQFNIATTGMRTPITLTATSTPINHEWWPLWAFGWATLAAAILLGVGFLYWRSEVKKMNDHEKKKHVTDKDGLPYLPDAYSIKDSLVTNATLITGLVTAVFGTGDILKVLGDDVTNAAAQALVGTAVASGLLGAAPVVLQMLRKTSKTAKDGHPANTKLGMLLASALVLGAAGGQLVVLEEAVRELGITPLWRLGALSVLLALLGLYGYRNYLENLRTGTLKVSTKRTPALRVKLVNPPAGLGAAPAGSEEEESDVFRLVTPPRRAIMP